MRMDSHIYPDYVVPPSYDSLLGKVCQRLKILISFFALVQNYPRLSSFYATSMIELVLYTCYPVSLCNSSLSGPLQESKRLIG